MDVPLFGEVGTEVLHVATAFFNVNMLPVLATVSHRFVSLNTAQYVYRMYQLHIPPPLPCFDTFRIRSCQFYLGGYS